MKIRIKRTRTGGRGETGGQNMRQKKRKEK